LFAPASDGQAHTFWLESLIERTASGKIKPIGTDGEKPGQPPGHLREASLRRPLHPLFLFAFVPSRLSDDFLQEATHAINPLIYLLFTNPQPGRHRVPRQTSKKTGSGGTTDQA
jgi:hypothetical protein